MTISIKKTNLAELAHKRKGIIAGVNRTLDRKKMPPIVEPTYENFLNQLKVIESLRVRDSIFQLNEVTNCPYFNMNDNRSGRLKEWLQKILSNEELTPKQKNIHASEAVAYLGALIEDNYGIYLLDDSARGIDNLRDLLDGKPKFSERYQLGDTWDDESLTSYMFELKSGWSSSTEEVPQLREDALPINERFYTSASCLDLTRYIGEDPPNLFRMIFHGSSSGIAGSIRLLEGITREEGIPTYFGGASKTQGENRVGVIYDPTND